MSTLMFWNKQNSNNQNSEAKNTKNGRNWLHAPDVLVNGHVAYLVKFLGSTPVEQAKGIEVVKEAIRRLQFTQQIKKAEGGSNVKTKKVEITVSVDGVAIQEPRTQTILHQFPLHKISYCADEKGVKKFFSFIAKTGTSTTPLSSSDDTTTNSSNSSDDGHECFVFISNKLASDITLTIGQAFDLAYRRYVNDSGKHVEVAKLQSQSKQLEHSVNVYRQRLKDLSEMVSKTDLDKLLIRLGLRDICDVPSVENGVDNHFANINGSKTPDLGIDVSSPNNEDQLLIETSPKHFAPIVPPRNIQNQINSTLDAFKPSIGTKLEGLLLNSDSDSDFDPRAPDNDISNGNKITNDLFGFEPPKPTLGQQLFSANHNNNINNSHGAPTSPPPILAPPPQKSTPRRSTNVQNNMIINNGSAHQDLFGSTPFNPQGFNGTQNLDSVDFGYSYAQNNSQNLSFSEEMKVLANNSSKLDNLLTMNQSLNQYNGSSPAQTLTNSKQNPFGIIKSPPSSLHDLTNDVLRSKPLSTLKMEGFAPKNYDVFKNPLDADITNGGGGGPSTKTSCDTNSDLFKDFAISAFNDFKQDSNIKSKHPRKTHEFSNEITNHSDASFLTHSFEFTNKTSPKKDLFNPDDFTLESLDPLKN